MVKGIQIYNSNADELRGYVLGMASKDGIIVIAAGVEEKRVVIMNMPIDDMPELKEPEYTYVRYDNLFPAALAHELGHFVRLSHNATNDIRYIMRSVADINMNHISKEEAKKFDDGF